tara:strand:- start:3516 stop:4499 length:984 start_codon:yes stop_codon:yes gene_type:complete
MVKIEVNNKVFYLLLSVLIIAIIGLTVFAIAPPNGHELSELGLAQISSTNIGVGIGVQNPSSKLHVGIRSGTGSDISIGPNQNNRATLSYDSGQTNMFSIGTRHDSTQHFAVLNIKDGKVGIGTTSLSELFEVNGNIVVKGSRKMTLSPTSETTRPGGAWTGGGGVSIQGDSEGWTFGTHALGTSNNLIGTIGFQGEDNTLERIFMGPSHTDQQLSLDVATGDVAIAGKIKADNIGPSAFIREQVTASHQVQYPTEPRKTRVSKTCPADTTLINWGVAKHNAGTNDQYSYCDCQADRDNNRVTAAYLGNVPIDENFACACFLLCLKN